MEIKNANLTKLLKKFPSKSKILHAISKIIPFYIRFQKPVVKRFSKDITSQVSVSLTVETNFPPKVHGSIVVSKSQTRGF